MKSDDNVYQASIKYEEESGTGIIIGINNYYLERELHNSYTNLYQ